MLFADIISGLISPITSIVTNYQTNKAKKQARKDMLEDAKVKGEIARIDKITSGELDYDIEAQRQMKYSWKDEYLVIVLTLPFIFSFIPVAQDHVIIGWEYIAKAPDWYQWSFMGIIIATFGLRTMAKFKR